MKPGVLSEATATEAKLAALEAAAAAKGDYALASRAKDVRDKLGPAVEALQATTNRVNEASTSRYAEAGGLEQERQHVEALHGEDHVERRMFQLRADLLVSDISALEARMPQDLPPRTDVGCMRPPPGHWVGSKPEFRPE